MQDNLIGAAKILIGIEPMSAPNGGDVCYQLDLALIRCVR